MRCPNCGETFAPGANGAAPQAAKRYTMNGVTKTADEWARMYGLNRSTFVGRVARGWTLTEAIHGKKK